MERTKVSKIIKYVGGELISGKGESIVETVVIDSREASKNSLFVALEGEQTDGHRFIKNAYDSGARTFLISHEDVAKEYAMDVFEHDDSDIILVDDTLNALQDMSGDYLQSMDMRCIAVTGSVGKTTTRDMLYAAVSEVYKAGTNKKNYNSETGLPLTLLSFEKDMEIGVLEMGMDAKGQIARLAEISQPEAAIITNVGISHIERLGSRENILEAKMEVTTGFDSENTLVINAGDELLVEATKGPLPYRVIRVGIENQRNDDKKKDNNRLKEETLTELDYEISDIRDLGIDGIIFCIKNNNSGEEMEIPLDVPGSHNAINYALAVAGAEVMGVPMKEAVKGISKMKMTGSRLRVVETGSLRIIDDAYNAAPSSMISALSTLSNTKAKRKVAILGGINELGEISEKEHRNIGRHASICNIDLMITIGDMAAWISDETKKNNKDTEYMHFDTKEELYPVLKELLKPGDVVLLKASRSYELDKIAEEITKWT